MQNHTSNDATWSLNKDVHDPPRSPYWFACFRDSDGRRVRWSTKTTDKTLAQEIAMRWAQIAQAGRRGKLTESACRTAIATLYEQAVGEPLHFKTARSYLAEWLEGTKADNTPASVRRYEQIVNTFLAHVGIKADRLLREITPADVRSWRDALKAKGLSPTTVNGSLKVLRMPFKAAHDNGIIDLNPCTKNAVRPFKDEARNVSKDVFAPQQVAALIEAAPNPDWKGMIMLGFFSGLRLRDCSELRWSNVDLDRQVIAVTTRKTRKDVTVPIHPQFTAWLKKQTRGIGKAPVFPSLAGKNGSGRSGLSMTFKRIMGKAKISGRLMRESAGGAGRSHSSLSFHSLRHSFNSALANAGVLQEIRQKLTGHTSAEMNTHYTHHEIATLRGAIEKLPGLRP